MMNPFTIYSLTLVLCLALLWGCTKEDGPVFFDLAIGECSGLSGYVPVAAYPDLNAYYRTLAWTVHDQQVDLSNTPPRNNCVLTR